MNVETQSPATLAHKSDVLIIGGGPGGSSSAITLAEKGYNVVLLEKARHPRFHIGESLLPANLPLFERLGVADEIRAIGMEKWGAEFVSPWHTVRSQTFEFAEAWKRVFIVLITYLSRQGFVCKISTQRLIQHMGEAGAGEAETVARHSVGDTAVGAVDEVWAGASADRRYIDGILCDREAFPDPLPLVVEGRDPGIRLREVVGAPDRHHRVLAHTGKIVPKGMQFTSTRLFA